MKTLKITMLALVIGFTARAEEIRFFKGTWEEVVAHSKEVNKPIFVDIYATWCGPCKWMERDVFTSDHAGKYYNENFVNYRVDAEEEEEEFVESMNIEAFPTLAYFNAEGQLLKKEVGALNAEGFVALGEEVNRLMKSLSKGTPKVADREAYADYVAYMAGVDKKAAGELAQTYMKAYSGIEDEHTWKILEMLVENTSDAYFENILEGIGVYAEMESFISFFNKMYSNTISRAVEQEDYASVTRFKDFEYEVRRELDALDAPREAYDLETDATYYKKAGMYDEFIETTDKRLMTYYKDDAETLSETASDVSDEFGNEYFDYIIRWALKSKEIENTVYVNFVIATIYDANGDSDNAKKYAKEALALSDDKDVQKKIKQYIKTL